MLNGWLNEKFLSLLGFKGQVASPKLEQVAPSHVSILNALYRLRPWPVRIGQQNFEVNAEWSPEHAEILNAWTIVIQAQDSRIELVVEQSILQHFIAELDPSLILSELSEGLLALLLELALEPTLEQLEGTFRTSLAVLAVVKESGPATIHAPVLVALRIRNGMNLSFPCMLRLTSGDLARFGTNIEHLPEHTGRFADVSLPIYVRWGVVDLPVSALQNLSPGDIILPDDVCGDPDTPMLVIADQLIAKGEREGDGYRLLDGLRRMEAFNIWGQSQGYAANRSISDISVREANVRVVFDLCWAEINRREVGTLNAYDMVHVDSISNGDVNIVVHGTRIGRGTLTEIGNTIGVQVTRL